MSFEVRRMALDELEPALQLFSGFGLNESLSIAQSYHKSSPEQFYVAIHEGERSSQVVGACASPMTTPDSAFLGLYVMDKRFQGQGLGVQLFDSCIKSLNGANCGLSAIPAKYYIYKNKAGFNIEAGSSLMIFAHSPINIGHFRSPESILPTNFKLKIGIDLEKESSYLDRLIDFDSTLHGCRRKTILKDSCQKIDTSLVSVYDESSDRKVVGYGLIRPDISGSSMPGPVYAESPEIAQVIIRALFQSSLEHAQNAQKGKVAIYSNSKADSGMKLIKNTLEMSVVDECCKLYTKFVPDFDYSKLYVCHTPDFSC